MSSASVEMARVGEHESFGVVGAVGRMETVVWIGAIESW